ncbi:MAG: sodium-dependent bicarbonate transport family permease [Betaproteobacteria bacterium RIFCSPLOWO2_02_FULL_67_19]|nr:MAG: sodium-dependent bicarbonate transport family permease [Betaproteobacteria bacterium RIFCSPLOWO2_02_FULL_67_19]
MIDPVTLFFALGVIAGLLRSDLKMSSGLYETLSVFLLVAIGLKGGVELARAEVAQLLWPIVIVALMGCGTPLVAYPVLRRLGRLSQPDAASIAAHYGSVSVVTFAVCVSYLARLAVPFEGHMAVFLVILEVPALAIGVLLAKGIGRETRWAVLAREVLCGKAVVLLTGSLLIGWISGADGLQGLERFYMDLFKGMLSLFLLGMGLITAARLEDVRRSGAFLVGFGILMPLVSAVGGVVVGQALGLSVGGTTLLATLYASASYIAAPAAMRIAIPEANPALSIGAALGVTFPFNVFVGVPLYHWMATLAHRTGG